MVEDFYLDLGLKELIFYWGKRPSLRNNFMEKTVKVLLHCSCVRTANGTMRSTDLVWVFQVLIQHVNQIEVWILNSDRAISLERV